MTTKATKAVKEVANQVEETSLMGLNLSGLETSETTVVPAEGGSFNDIEFLRTADPNNFFSKDNTSSKYDPEREIKVQEGLKAIAALSGNFEVNELVVLLGKWWEVKPARKAIKNMLDEQAEANGYASDIYLQINLKEQIDNLKNIQQSIDRLRYCITYFKPRGELSNKEPMTQIQVNGSIYNIKVRELTLAKEQAGTDKALLKELVLAKATKSSNIEEL